MNDYNKIYTLLPKDRDFTAKEVGYAAATLSAMVRRGLLEDLGGKPKHYQLTKDTADAAKIEKLISIPSVIEFITVWYDNRELGELLVHKNTSWFHCDGSTPLSKDDIHHIKSYYYFNDKKQRFNVDFCNSSADGE